MSTTLVRFTHRKIEKARKCGPFRSSGGGIRTRDLRVMRRLKGFRYIAFCRACLLLGEAKSGWMCPSCYTVCYMVLTRRRQGPPPGRGSSAAKSYRIVRTSKARRRALRRPAPTHRPGLVAHAGGAPTRSQSAQHNPAARVANSSAAPETAHAHANFGARPPGAPLRIQPRRKKLEIANRERNPRRRGIAFSQPVAIQQDERLSFPLSASAGKILSATWT
jgi:hypothetical protein